MRALLPILAAFLFSCAQPRTQLPSIPKSELQAERAYQKDFTYKQDFTYIYDIPPTRKVAQQRLSSITRRIGPAAMKLCDDLRLQDKNGAKRRCLFDVALNSSDFDDFNAYADGNKVILTRKMMQLVPRDDQLAFIIAHEFAHNIMEHLRDQENNMMGGALMGAILDAALSGAGAPTGGGFGGLGARAGALSYSPEYEHEADYVGLYIMARAGYALEKTPDVWRIMVAVNPDDEYIKSTHPTSPARFVMMKKTIEEIAAKRKNKQPLIPQMRQDVKHDVE